MTEVSATDVSYAPQPSRGRPLPALPASDDDMTDVSYAPQLPTQPSRGSGRGRKAPAKAAPPGMPTTSLVALSDLNAPLSAHEMEQLNRLNMPDQAAAIAARLGQAASRGRGSSRPHKQLTGPSSSRGHSRNHQF